jgi:acetyl-CoA carboxylase biotin carboxyl carrier protein
MLEIQDIKELIQLFNESQIDELSVEHGNSKLNLKKRLGNTESVLSIQPTVSTKTVANPSSVAPTTKELANSILGSVKNMSPSEPKTDENLLTVTSPMVGTFYASSSPEASNYVSVGSQVKNGDVVCIVEAMKLFNEIESEVNGEVVEILVQNGQLVEYGQPLFHIRPSK